MPLPQTPQGAPKEPRKPGGIPGYEGPPVPAPAHPAGGIPGYEGFVVPTPKPPKPPPPGPVPVSAVKAYSLSLSLAIQERIGHFDFNSVNNLPYTAAQTAMSQLPTRLVKGLAAGLPQAIALVNSDTRFAGLPGFLIRAKLVALGITDAAYREQALDLIDRLGGLPIDQQTALLAIMRGQARYEIAPAAGPGEPSPVWGGVQAVFPGAAPTQTGVMLPPERPGTFQAEQMVEIVKELFPGLPVEAIGEPANPVRIVMDAFYSAARDVEAYETHTQDEGPLLASWEYASSIWPMLLFGGVLGKAGQAAFAGARGLAAQASYQAIGPVAGLVGFATEHLTPFGLGKPIRNAVGGMVRTGEERVGQILMPPAYAMLDAQGVHADDPNRDEAAAAISNILALIILHQVGEIARAVKLTGAVPRDVAAAKLGIDEASLMRLGDLNGIRDVAQLLGRGISFIDHTVDRLALTIRGKTLEQWVTSRPALRMMASIEKIKAKHPGDTAAAAMAIEERYGSTLPVTLAYKLAETPRELLPNMLVGYGTDANARGLMAQRAEVQRELLDRAAEGNLDAAEISRLKLRDMELERAIPSAVDKVPLYEFPHARVMRAALYEPITRLERSISAMYGFPGNIIRHLPGLDATPTSRAFWFRFINDLPRHPFLYNQFRGERPPNWRELDMDTMTRLFRDAHIPVEEIRTLMDAKFKVKNDTELYDWLTRDVSDAVDRALPKNTPPELRAAILRIWDRPTEGRYRSVYTVEHTDAAGVVHRELEYVVPHEVEPGIFQGSPSQAAEMMNHISLPDPDMLWEAHSVIQRGVRAVERVGVLRASHATSIFYRLPKYMLQFSTSLLKGPILVLRLPAMIARIQLEQMLRMSQSGYKPLLIFPQGVRLLERGYAVLPGGIPVPRYAFEAFAEEAGGVGLIMPDARYERFNAPHDIGLIQEALFEPATTHLRTETKTTDFARGVREPKSADFEAWRSTITMLAEEPYTRQFARLELDPDAMYRWLQEKDAAGEFVNTTVRSLVYDQIGPRLKAPVFTGDIEARVQTLLRREAEFMRQALADDPYLIRSVAQNKWITRPGDVSHVRQYFGEETVFEEYQAKAAELAAVKRVLLEQGHGGGPEMAERNISPELRRAYQAERLRLMRELQAMEAEAGITMEQVVTAGDKGFVRLTDEADFRSALADKWRSAEIEFPQTIVVDHSVRTAGWEQGTAKEWLRKLRTLPGWNAMFYKAFKAATWADMHWTRGSLYYQVAEETYRILKARGYTNADATAFAEARGSAVARDLMYDLSARTTYQRALKDVFWFGPAYQEVVSTWLGKIPSQYYWPVGMAMLAGKGLAMYGLLQELGIIQKDSNGTDVIAIPGFSAFVERVTGKKVPEWAFIKTSGLNLVTSQLGPSMSYLPSLALAEATRRWGGTFKWLSDRMLPFGLDITMTPRPIIYALEALGAPKEWLGTLEVFSKDYMYRQYDTAYARAMQMAGAALIDKGVKPPVPEDFADTTDPATGARVLSAAADSKFVAAQDAYLKKLFADADSWFTGTAWAKLLGATVTPGAINVTTQEKEEFSKFWDTIFPEDEQGTRRMTEAQYNLVESHLADHPSSVAYHTWTTAFGKATRALPYESTGDEAYYDEFWTGERRVKGQEEWGLQFAYEQSKRMYYAQLAGELRVISPTLDIPTLLRNGYERAQALNAYHASMDRYLSLELNPTLAAQLAKNSRLASEHYGNPVEAYEAARLAKGMQLINQIAPAFMEGGARSEDYRAFRAEFAQLYSENGEFGAPWTTSEKQMAWFYDNVLGPFWDRVDPLFTAAELQGSWGAETGKYWEQIRRIKNSYTQAEGVSPTVAALARREGAAELPRVNPLIGPDGTVYPTPEEAMWGNRAPAEQMTVLYNWATKPIAWLSDFERAKLGYKPFEGDDKMYARIAAIENKSYALIHEKQKAHAAGWYSGGDEYNREIARREAAVKDLAKSYGPEGVAAARLNAAPPFARLDTIDFGASSRNWEYTINAVKDAIRHIQEPTQDMPHGYSLRSFSDTAVAWKKWIYGIITDVRSKDPVFNGLWDELSAAISIRGIGNPEGSYLYEAILFGNFDPEGTHMPDAVVRAGALPPSGGWPLPEQPVYPPIGGGK